MLQVNNIAFTYNKDKPLLKGINFKLDKGEHLCVMGESGCGKSTLLKVVYGLFGLGLFVLFLGFGTSILAGSLTLSIMTLPVIISTTEEALRAVPQSFRTVSMSLGATKWQTIRRIVLPQALPGILTGVILGLERAAGETGSGTSLV